MSEKEIVVPEVGMGCTVVIYSDRHAATVVDVKGKSVFIQMDIPKRIDKNGQSECQEYEFERNPNSLIHEFTLRKNGKYVKKGHEIKNGVVLWLGEREEYYDFSF